MIKKYDYEVKLRDCDYTLTKTVLNMTSSIQVIEEVLSYPHLRRNELVSVKEIRYDENEPDYVYDDVDEQEAVFVNMMIDNGLDVSLAFELMEEGYKTVEQFEEYIENLTNPFNPWA